MPKVPIDKDIPIPDHPLALYPWQDMKVGDSFLVPADAKPNSFRVIANRAGRKFDRVFSIRQTEEGLRCWRVK